MPTGVRYCAETPVMLVLGPILLLLLVFPWRGEVGTCSAVAGSLRAWTAVLGALVATVGPVAVYLFSNPKPLEGWWLHGAAWTLTARAYTAFAAYAARAETPGAGEALGWTVGLAMIALLAAPFVWLLKNGATTVGWASLALGALAGAPFLIEGAALRRASAEGEALGAT